MKSGAVAGKVKQTLGRRDGRLSAKRKGCRSSDASRARHRCGASLAGAFAGFTGLRRTPSKIARGGIAPLGPTWTPPRKRIFRTGQMREFKDARKAMLYRHLRIARGAYIEALDRRADNCYT